MKLKTHVAAILLMFGVTGCEKSGSELDASYYKITVTPNEYCRVQVKEQEKAGEKVRVVVTVLDETMKVMSVACNGAECEPVDNQSGSTAYEFTMPAKDVALKAEVDLDYHLITPEQGEHTTLNILNCHYYYGTPEHVIQAYLEQLVRYTVSVDPGYELMQAAISASGTQLPYMYVPDDPEYGACWQVQMPNEALTIRTSAVEKTDYAGKHFTGQYSGFELDTPAGRIVSGSNLPLTMTLKENTTFEVKSSDLHAYDFDGCYVYDEAADKFTYLRETCKKTYGLGGTYMDGDIFIDIPNIIDNKPEYTKYYFTSSAPFAYTCAADEYNQKFLLEITKGGVKAYYYAEPQYRYFQKAEVNFDRGNSIGSPSSALVSVEGTSLFRYALESSDTAPAFTYKGNEAGRYVSRSGLGPALILDGFGKGTIGNTEGTYTRLGSIITFASDDSVTKYVIDLINLTYYEVESDAVWNGAPHYYAESEYGYNSEVSQDGWVKGWVDIYMDKDCMGNDMPRYASIYLWLPDRFGSRANIISECVPYVYDPDTKTLLLSQVAQCKKDGSGQERRDILFSVEADSRSITFVTDYVYSLSTPYKYIYTLGLALTPAQ